jgi:Na+/glutamate symporter
LDAGTIISIAFGTIGLVTGGVAGFFSAKSSVRKEFQTKHDDLKEKIHSLSVEMEKLKGKDELQQQILDQLKTNVLDRLPEIFNNVPTDNNNGQ